MKNPWINYILVRVGLFVALLAIMLAFSFDPFLAALLAAVISLAISMLFFGKQRDALSRDIYERMQKRGDKDTAVEDAKVDGEEAKDA
jgi:L-lactate permease